MPQLLPQFYINLLVGGFIIFFIAFVVYNNYILPYILNKNLTRKQLVVLYYSNFILTKIKNLNKKS